MYTIKIGTEKEIEQRLYSEKWFAELTEKVTVDLVNMFREHRERNPTEKIIGIIEIPEIRMERGLT